MLLKLELGLFIFFISNSVFAQEIQTRVRFAPEHPNVNEAVDLYYRLDSTIFKVNYEIDCKIYFTGANEFSQAVKIDFPVVLDIDLERENDLWHGTFCLPAKSTAMVAVFIGKLENSIDNNNGEGYWMPVFNGGEPIPGALSGIADLYAGSWDPEYSYHLKKKKDLARILFERDFNLNPKIKRSFTRSYLATLDINDEKDRQLFKVELDHYAQYSDLDEWELLGGVSKNYARINEIDSATKYQNLVLERYPNGSWALQTNSLKPAMEIEIEKNFDKKREMYNRFKETYCHSYPDEFTRRIMNGRRGQILQNMAPFFAQERDFASWYKEVDELDDESKCYVYNRTARFLMDEKSSSEHVGYGKNKDASKSIVESPLLTYKLPMGIDYFGFSEKLSRQSLDWWRKNLDGPRRHIDAPFFSDQEIRGFREARLAEFLDILGQSLLLQNKFNEAPEILKEAAITLARRNEALINEHYIEALIKSNQGIAAINEAEIVIRLGKSTSKINDFHKSMVNNSTLREAAIVDLSSQFKKQMINEKTPDVILLDSSGEQVSIKVFKGKTVVIDFWATWCPPCIAGLESMAEVVEKYKNESDIVFLFVNTELFSAKSKERATRLFQDKNYDMGLFFDPEFKATTLFKVDALPTKMIIDKNGKIRFRHVGLMGAKEQQIDELITMIELVR